MPRCKRDKVLFHDAFYTIQGLVDIRSALTVLQIPETLQAACGVHHFLPPSIVLGSRLLAYGWTLSAV